MRSRGVLVSMRGMQCPPRVGTCTCIGTSVKLPKALCCVQRLTQYFYKSGEGYFSAAEKDGYVMNFGGKSWLISLRSAP